jgi:co-chaperonin GroES (HSP10)
MTEKIISISPDVKPKNIMSDNDSTAAQIEARAVLDRMDKEKEDLRTQELILDGSNKIKFIGYPYIFEALGEKIIVSIDVFKSGYECKVCKGLRKIKAVCECEINGRPGFKYPLDSILEIRKTLGDQIADTRSLMPCLKCNGDYVAARHEETCTACKGRGAVIILPKESEALPTTGTVVSIGKLAQRLIKDDEWDYKHGDKVLFSQFAGQFIPCKAGVLLKILDYNQVITKIEGADDLNSFDFILSEKD